MSLYCCSGLSLRDVTVYSLLFTASGKGLLDIIATGVDNVELALTTQGRYDVTTQFKYDVTTLGACMTSHSTEHDILCLRMVLYKCSCQSVVDVFPVARLPEVVWSC